MATKKRKALFEITPPADRDWHQCDWEISCTKCLDYYNYCMRNPAEPTPALMWMAEHARSHGVRSVLRPFPSLDHNLFLIKRSDDPKGQWDISCLKCDFHFWPFHGPETLQTQDMLRRHMKECKGRQHGKKSKTESR